jgi:hypothetical protein
MKNLVFLCLSLVLSASALAQSIPDLGREASYIARWIQRDAQYLSAEDRSDISQNLNSIRSILEGRSTGGYGSQYTCVSRDNDGQNPYVIAVKEGVNLIRLKETFNSNQSCQAALGSTRPLGGVTLMCVSKDNDGSNPFQIGILNSSGIIRIGRTVSSNAVECQATLNKMRPNRGGVSLCASKDNDGQRPYVAMNIILATGAIEVGSESFTEISACERFLEN